MKIRLFKLAHCRFCAEAEKMLSGHGYTVRAVDVSDPENREQCDRLEDFFESTRYPKLILENKSKTVFINPYEGKKMPPFGDNVFEYFESIEQILEIVKKYNNEV